MVADIENNFIKFIVLRPSNLPATPNQKCEGRICDLPDKKVIFEVTKARSIELLRDSCESESYDISFKLNRLSYRLQHYALEFILDHELFVRLIDNSDYRSIKPSETKRVHAKAKSLRLVFPLESYSTFYNKMSDKLF